MGVDYPRPSTEDFDARTTGDSYPLALPRGSAGRSPDRELTRTTSRSIATSSRSRKASAAGPDCLESVFFDALVEAQKEDRPIFFWIYEAIRAWAADRTASKPTVVCSDPRVIQLMKQFVPAVGAPQEFREAKKNELEYKLVFGAMNRTEFGGKNGMDHWHVQGMYVVTRVAGCSPGATTSPTRGNLARNAQGPDAVPEDAEERPPAGRRAGSKKDQVSRKFAGVKPPDDGLELRVVTRGLTSTGIRVEDDTRHPFYYKLDRLWYKKDEARKLLPAGLRVGARSTVPRPVLERLVTFNLGTNYEPTFYWHTEDIKEAVLTTEVVAVKGDTVEVRFQGKAKLGPLILRPHLRAGPDRHGDV